MKMTRDTPCRACHGTGYERRHPPLWDNVKFGFDALVSSVFMAVQMAAIICVFTICIVVFYNWLIHTLARQ